MDKYQAGYEILCFLSAADGEFHQTEIAVINEFLLSNVENVTFNTDEIIEKMESMTAAGRKAEFIKAVTTFKKLSTNEERVRMMDFGFKLILSDKKFTDAEGFMFGAIAEAWGIDIQKFIKSFEKRMLK